MRLILIFIVFLIPLWVQAQYAQTIRSGRPGQSIGAFTVGKKVLQFQSGLTFDWSNNDIANEESRGALSTTVIRYGVYERFELSAVVGFSDNRLETENGLTMRGGLSAAQLGFRVNIRDGHGSGPNIAIQSRYRLNVLSEDFNQKYLATTTILSLSQSLGPTLGFGVNLGVSWNGNDPAPLGRYTANINMAITDHLEAFVENYGDVSNQDFDTRFDAGVGIIATSNLKFDFSFGYGMNDRLEDYFLDFGLSWRFLTGDRSLEKSSN